MPRKLRQLRADLLHAGWRVERQSGTSHQIRRHPLIPDLEVNLAGQDGKDAKPTKSAMYVKLCAAQM